MKTAIFILCSALIAGWVSAADLSGTIHDEKGAPISGATVKIHTAGMRTGTSPYCPSCWTDCRKIVKTAHDGTFTFKDVSDKLVFRLLVLAQGYEPAFIPKVDPKNGPAQGSLKSRDITAFHGKQLISGTVLGMEGKPVAGALIEPEFCQNGRDPLAITNEKGDFILTCPKDIDEDFLTVRAAGYAPIRVQHANGGGPPLKINLQAGVIISGRVTNHGKPMAGIGVGLVQTDRSIEHWLGPEETVTDTDGTFHFYNASAKTEWAVYGLMNSLTTQGAIPVRTIHTGADETTLAVGDLAIVPGATIKGRLNEIDGKPFQPETRITISRDVAWDTQILDVNPDGSFQASGIPIGEKIDVSAPCDHEIQKVSSGFQIDPWNNRVIGTLAHSLSDFAIDLIWKDEATKQAELNAIRYKEVFGAFFAQEKFTPGQVKLFISDMETHDRPLQAGESPSKKGRREMLEEKLTNDFSARTAQDYTAFDDHRNGMVIVSWFSPSGHDWLTDDERNKLADVFGPMSRELEEQQAKNGKLSKEEQLAQSNLYIDRLQAEGNKVLPKAKHATLAKSVATMRGTLKQMVESNSQ